MSVGCEVPKLPRDPVPGAEVCDRYGNRWKFVGREDGWISIGVLSSPQIVTESRDGVITPGVFDQLTKLRSFTGDLRPLKILPGRDAYWYYFRSSDKSFRFSPEGEDQLRLEVDRGRLFQLLTKYQCQGPRGDSGVVGPKGLAGVAGPAEICYAPQVAGGRLDFAIYTPTPLTLSQTEVELPDGHVPDISVRVFRADGGTTSGEPLQKLATYYYGYQEAADFQSTRELFINQSIGLRKADVCAIPLSRVLLGGASSGTPLVTVLVDPLGVADVRVTSSLAIDLNRTKKSVKFDQTTGIVCGSIYLKGQVWDDGLCVKSRQCGPDGSQGRDGESALQVVECELDHTSVFASCPILTMRIDCESQSILTICSDLLSRVCVDQVKFLPNAGSLSDRGALSATFAAAQMVVDDCKLIESYQVALPDESDEDRELQLSHWAPQAGCVTRRHYDRHTFPWIRQTDIGACDSTVKWYGVDVVRNAKYPWAIVKGQAPEKDECCQEDFFYCPNIQNGGCPSGGGSAAS